MSDKKIHANDEVLLADATNEILKQSRRRCSRAFGERTIRMIANRFIDNKLHNFPKLCQEARRVNQLQQKQLREMGNEGGWSEGKEFKFDYAIPSELYMFMINMVHREFWTDENKKVWRSFMRAILRGDDAMILLRKVKMYYDGANSKISFK